MSQVFRRRAELGVKLAFLALALVALTGFLYLLWQVRSAQPTSVVQAQPIPFSHKHHVGDDGMDCRYCHTTVETSAYAGMPSTRTCLTCHSQLFTDQPLLAKLHESARSGKPIPWNRVYVLPGFVYFNHSVHVSNGVACIECHGRVDQMPLTWRASPMVMQWCLGCHRNPAPHLSPPEKVFAMEGFDGVDADTLARLAAKRPDRRRLTDCSTCHR